MPALRICLPGGGAPRVRGWDGSPAGRLHPVRNRHPPDRPDRHRCLRLLRQVREGLPDGRDRLRPGAADADGQRALRGPRHRLQDDTPRREEGVSRRLGHECHWRPGHGAPAGPERPLRTRAPALGWQDPRQRRLHPVRRIARRDARRAVLLPGLLHVRHQAGDAPVGRPAHGGHHDLLHGHPDLRQGLRAVLPDGPLDGYQLRQGQGRPDRRAGGGRPHAAGRDDRGGRPGGRRAPRPGRALGRHAAGRRSAAIHQRGPGPRQVSSRRPSRSWTPR